MQLKPKARLATDIPSRPENQPWYGSSGVSIVVHKRSWREIFSTARLRTAQRKKKEPKKKESDGRGGLWKLPQPWKSSKDASQYFLDDFHRCLENPAGFSTVTTNPTAVN
jgi:hypothetical protein